MPLKGTSGILTAKILDSMIQRLESAVKRPIGSVECPGCDEPAFPQPITVIGLMDYECVNGHTQTRFYDPYKIR